MTKLVRKLKQMAKKRSHRKTVQKRKTERAQRDLERQKEAEKEKLEKETDREMFRISNPDADMNEYDRQHGLTAAAGDGGSDEDDGDEDESGNSKAKNANRVHGNPQVATIVGGIKLMRSSKKKKALTKKQLKRKEKNVERGVALVESLTKKWNVKKRRTKARAQIRNQDLN